MIGGETDVTFWVLISLLLKLLNLFCLHFFVLVDQWEGYFEPVRILKQWVCVTVSKILH